MTVESIPRTSLATLDEAAFGAATEVEPKFVSPSDPARNGPLPTTDDVRTGDQHEDR